MEETVPEGLYSSVQVLDLTGATYRQLDYWCREGIVRGEATGMGSGHRRLFRRQDVMVTAVLCKLRSCGLELSEARLLAEFLYKHPVRLDRDFLVITGTGGLYALANWEVLSAWMTDHPHDFIAVLRLDPLRERIADA